MCRAHFARMSDLREYNMIAGLSMGGYGALKAALTYPERYFGCASLSGSLDVTRKGRSINLAEWRGVFDINLQSGDELAGSRHDIFRLAEEQGKDPSRLPDFYLWCGTEDALIHQSRNFHALFEKMGVKHRFEESEGTHAWRWWDLHVQDALAYLLEE